MQAGITDRIWNNEELLTQAFDYFLGR